MDTRAIREKITSPATSGTDTPDFSNPYLVFKSKQLALPQEASSQEIQVDQYLKFRIERQENQIKLYATSVSDEKKIKITKEINEPNYTYETERGDIWHISPRDAESYVIRCMTLLGRNGYKRISRTEDNWIDFEKEIINNITSVPLGWKLHIPVHYDDLPRAVTILSKKKLHHFKAIPHDENVLAEFKTSERQAGKTITYYVSDDPTSIMQLAKTIREISREFKNADIRCHANPPLATDKPISIPGISETFFYARNDLVCGLFSADKEKPVKCLTLLDAKNWQQEFERFKKDSAFNDKEFMVLPGYGVSDSKSEHTIVDFTANDLNRDIIKQWNETDSEQKQMQSILSNVKVNRLGQYYCPGGYFPLKKIRGNLSTENDAKNDAECALRTADLHPTWSIHLFHVIQAPEFSKPKRLDKIEKIFKEILALSHSFDELLNQALQQPTPVLSASPNVAASAGTSSTSIDSKGDIVKNDPKSAENNTNCCPPRCSIS